MGIKKQAILGMLLVFGFVSSSRAEEAVGKVKAVRLDLRTNNAAGLGAIVTTDDNLEYRYYSPNQAVVNGVMATALSAYTIETTIVITWTPDPVDGSRMIKMIQVR